MRQPSLFDDIETPEPADLAPGEPAFDEPSLEHDGVPRLFDRPVMLRNDLHEAVERGRFEDARRCYLELTTAWGESRGLAPLAFLADMDLSMLGRPAGELLERWLSFSTHGIPDPRERRRAWRGLVRRLAPIAPPRTLVAASPACLVPVVNALWETAADAPGTATESRELVRDALLAGCDLCPSDVLDEQVRNVLAEDLGPAWLASLGAIRQLWAVPPIDEDSARLLLREAEAVADHEGPARRFWDCLRVSRSPLEDGLRHEARRRMKRLQPQLHALVLRGAV